jgi:putative transposase
VAGSIRSAKVIDILSRVISHRGAPAFLRSDNGPEFVATALLKWATENKIETALIDPGKPWQKGATESFNVKFRDECLSVEWFRNRLEAKVVIKEWMANYNEVRRYSSLGYRTPRDFVERLAPKGNSGVICIDRIRPR